MDTESFREIYLTTYNDLWSFARRYVESAAVAEEIVQDVFLKVWENRDKLKINTSIKSYLFGAVRNRALHVVEHSAVERKGDKIIAREQTEFSGPDSNIVNQDVDSAVMSALDSLPERQRAAMLLRLNNDMSYAEIGQALGISATAAGNLVVKGEAKLREILSKYL